MKLMDHRLLYHRNLFHLKRYVHFQHSFNIVLFWVSFDLHMLHVTLFKTRFKKFCAIGGDRQLQILHVKYIFCTLRKGNVCFE